MMDGNGLRELFLKVANGWHTYLPMKKVNANPLDEIPKTIVPELIRDLDQVKNRSEKYVVKGDSMHSICSNRKSSFPDRRI